MYECSTELDPPQTSWLRQSASLVDKTEEIGHSDDSIDDNMMKNSDEKSELRYTSNYL